MRVHNEGILPKSLSLFDNILLDFEDNTEQTGEYAWALYNNNFHSSSSFQIHPIIFIEFRIGASFVKGPVSVRYSFCFLPSKTILLPLLCRTFICLIFAVRFVLLSPVYAHMAFHCCFYLYIQWRKISSLTLFALFFFCSFLFLSLSSVRHLFFVACPDIFDGSGNQKQA